MKNAAILLRSGLAAGACLLLVGCGGGGSSSATKSVSNSKTRLIQTTRLSRAILAVTGIGRTITRAATPPKQKSWSMNGRILLFFSSAAGTAPNYARAAPATPPALDPGTGLFYTTTTNADGSGQQLLYVDEGLTQPAGYFKWSKPKWATAQPNTYPATITVTYNITAGNYAGVSGTMTITVNDPKFAAGLIALALTDSLHESASATLALSAEGVSGENKMDFGNGDSCTVADSTDSSGDLVQAISYPDGGAANITTDPNGDSTETYTNPDDTTAAPDLSGIVQPDGSDTIDDGSGDSTTVNVDPGDSGDGGGDSGGGGDSSDAIVGKAAKSARGTVKAPAPLTSTRPH